MFVISTVTALLQNNLICEIDGDSRVGYITSAGILSWTYLFGLIGIIFSIHSFRGKVKGFKIISIPVLIVAQ